MPYLFLVNLGPVQEFIATARRSRDLWFGSYLLSELSKAAAQAIVKHSGVSSLIFPAIENEADLAALNIPNRILAQINIEQGDLWGFAEDGQQRGGVKFAVCDRLHQIRKDAFEVVKGKRGKFDEDAAEKQIDDMLEYFWVALPLEKQEDYKDVRKRLEALMAARKVTRDFKPIKWGDNIPKPKSSLDGSRESVIPESAYPEARSSNGERKRKIEDLYKYYGAGQAERLSGVDLLKRHGNRGGDSRFPSTSHIAALPLLERLRQGDIAHAKRAWYAYTEKLIGLNVELETVPPRYGNHPVTANYEGELLFESRLRELLESSGVDKDKLEEAQKALRDFLKAATNGDKPIPYYAILLADGDSMGKVIDFQNEVKDHQALSKALNEFARSVQAIVEGDLEKGGHRGALVYAGGDDVLAFLPLHTVLQCAKTLADTFKKKLKDFKDKHGKPPTLSVGVVVAHHLEPLSEALALARAAERAAKSVRGKNALAVIISKRSGADRTVSGQWGDFDERLNLLIGLHVNEEIPDGAAYQLRDLALRLTVSQDSRDYDAKKDEALKKAMCYEAVRILGRKQPGGGAGGIDKATLEKLGEMLESDDIGVKRLADELIVARDFALAVILASNKKEPSYANVDH